MGALVTVFQTVLFRSSAWAQYRFDEEVTSLEDMELAQRLYRDRGRIGYVAEACVYHHHAESWPQVQRRFEREALALQRIMPDPRPSSRRHPLYRQQHLARLALRTA